MIRQLFICLILIKVGFPRFTLNWANPWKSFCFIYKFKRTNSNISDNLNFFFNIFNSCMLWNFLFFVILSVNLFKKYTNSYILSYPRRHTIVHFVRIESVNFNFTRRSMFLNFHFWIKCWKTKTFWINWKKEGFFVIKEISTIKYMVLIRRCNTKMKTMSESSIWIEKYKLMLNGHLSNLRIGH